jgi:hypothetical protein
MRAAWSTGLTMWPLTRRLWTFAGLRPDPSRLRPPALCPYPTIDNEDAAGRRGRPLADGRLWWRRFRCFDHDRQTHHELAALTDTETVSFHRAVVHLH